MLNGIKLVDVVDEELDAWAEVGEDLDPEEVESVEGVCSWTDNTVDWEESELDSDPL